MYVYVLDRFSILHSLFHRLGTFGDLRIFYTVESADPAMLALADGTPLFSYFSSPVSNTTLTSSTLLQSLTGLSLEECATRCLSDQACLAFARTVSVCELYLVSDDGMNSQFTSEAEYYEKLQEQVCIVCACVGHYVHVGHYVYILLLSSLVCACITMSIK